MVEAERVLINALQKMDLNYEEAQIYFNLLKYGKSGTIVRKLREDLPFIERTTLYSILRRLIEKGCVKEASSSQKLKNFIAIAPLEYFNNIFSKKKQEFEDLTHIKLNILDKIQKIYNVGLEISSEDLDPFIFPYVQSLIEAGWKIKTQKISKGINILGGEVLYEYQMKPLNPLEKKIESVGLIVSVYDAEIEHDNITLNFVIKQIKKSIKQLHEGDFDNLSVLDDEFELYGKKVLSIKTKARNGKSKTYFEFGKTAILPIRNKIFFLWEELIHDQNEYDKEEQLNVLKDVIKEIFYVEDITIT